MSIHLIHICIQHLKFLQNPLEENVFQQLLSSYQVTFELWMSWVSRQEALYFILMSGQISVTSVKMAG